MRTINEEQKIKLADARRALQKKSVPFHNVFNTPEGKQVLDALKSEFDPIELVKSDAHGTVVASAQRDVIRYIESMMKLREENFDENT